jgi:hypothetical protein
VLVVLFGCYSQYGSNWYNYMAGSGLPLAFFEFVLGCVVLGLGGGFECEGSQGRGFGGCLVVMLLL